MKKMLLISLLLAGVTPFPPLCAYKIKTFPPVIQNITSDTFPPAVDFLELEEFPPASTQ